MHTYACQEMSKLASPLKTQTLADLSLQSSTHTQRDNKKRKKMSKLHQPIV